CLRDVPRRLEIALDVLRRDVLAAGGDEDVLLAVGDAHEAVRVDLRDVARAKPAVVRQYLRGCRRVAVVAGEDRPASDQELAVVGEPELEARQGSPDGPEPVVLRRVRRCGGRALREAVALEDPDAERVEELGDLLGKWRSA